MDLAVQSQFLSPFREDHRISHDRRNSATRKVGVDLAGPIKYGGKCKTEEKVYVVLYSCCLTRGIFLKVLPSQETGEFIKSFKRLIARRGRSSLVYSDKVSTFTVAAKWLTKVKEDKKFHSFVSNQSITWRFDASRAP